MCVNGGMDVDVCEWGGWMSMCVNGGMTVDVCECGDGCRCV